jgi:hypothetical protein
MSLPGDIPLLSQPKLARRYLLSRKRRMLNAAREKTDGFAMHNPTTKSGEEGGCPREMKVDAQWRGLRGVNRSPRVQKGTKSLSA